MSNQNPTSARKRRRIAGERTRPARPGATPEAGEQPEGGPAPGPATGTPEAHPDVRAAAKAAAKAAANAAKRPRREKPAKPAREPAGAGLHVALPVLAGVGLLAALLVVVAVAGLGWFGVHGLGVPALRDVRQADAVSTADRDAPAAAERAAAAILSYNYRSLGADEKSAESFMTAHYRGQYSRTFDKLVRPNATRLKAKVVADVRASGVTTQSEPQPGRVRVLLFVNQTTTSAANGGQPQTALNRVTFDMVDEGGTWRVDQITSY